MSSNIDFVVPMFVPGHRPERFETAAQSGADAVIIDLEDTVPVEAKLVAHGALRTDFTTLPVLVHINAVGTPWHQEDLVAFSALSVSAIVLTKAGLGQGLNRLLAALAGPSIGLIALIETARGLIPVQSRRSMV